MKSRYVVLCLSLVLALALAVPALGGPTNPIASISASVKQIANKALNKAKAAQSAANAAQSTANSALNTADAAQKTANTVQTAVKTAQTTANSAKTAADAAQATANSKFGNTTSVFGGGTGSSTSNSKFEIVSCPSGQQITGGGYETSGTGSDSVTAEYTGSYGDAWLALLERINGQAATSWGVRAIAICAGP